MAIPIAQMPIGNGATAINVTRSSWDNTCRLSEVTTSGNVNGTRYAPVVRDPSWTAEAPIDDAGFIEVALGNTGSTVSSLRLYETVTKYDAIANTTIERITKSTDSTGDVPRMSISGRGGDITVNN